MRPIRAVAAFLSLIALACAGAAIGQSLSPPPQPAPVSIVAGAVSLSAGTTTARATLPGAAASLISATLFNVGSADAYCAAGGSSVIATTSSPIFVASGTHVDAWIGSSGYVACITASGSTTVLIWHANGPVNLGGAGATSAGLPAGAATAARQDTGNGSLASIATNTSLGATAAKQSAGTATAPSGVVVTTQPVRSPQMYAATQVGYTGYATPGDLTGLCGNASRTVYPLQLFVSVHATTGTLLSFYYVKRSSADTGGTPTTLTAFPYDSNTTAALSAPVSFASAPSAGTLVGNLYVQELSAQVATTAASSSISNFGTGTQAFSVGLGLALHGTGECVYVNLNGVALPAGFSYTYTWQWIEQ